MVHGQRSEHSFILFYILGEVPYLVLLVACNADGEQ
jgi:hypothetical protein